jgi:hypothetical protein
MKVVLTLCIIIEWLVSAMLYVDVMALSVPVCFHIFIIASLLSIHPLVIVTPRTFQFLYTTDKESSLGVLLVLMFI